MLREIVVPKNNEAEFVEIALRLGLRKLCFLYDFESDNPEKMKGKLSRLNDIGKIDMITGYLVNNTNMHKAIKFSRILAAQSSEGDRKLIESKKVRLIYGFEQTHKNDYLHQRASGLNHVLCRLMHQNDITVGFSYSSLFHKDDLSVSVLMGRMMQNIALCQKFNVNTVIASFAEKPFDMRSQHDISSLFSMLGMNGRTIKESLAREL